MSQDKNHQPLTGPSAPKAPSPYKLARSKDHHGQSGPEVEEQINLPAEDKNLPAAFIPQGSLAAVVPGTAIGSGTVKRYLRDVPLVEDDEPPIVLTPSSFLADEARRRAAAATRRAERESRAEALLAKADTVRDEVKAKLSDVVSHSGPSVTRQRQIGNLRKELAILDGIREAIGSRTSNSTTYLNEVESAFDEAETQVEEMTPEDRLEARDRLAFIWGPAEREAWKQFRRGLLDDPDAQPPAPGQARRNS